MPPPRNPAAVFLSAIGAVFSCCVTATTIGPIGIMFGAAFGLAGAVTGHIGRERGRRDPETIAAIVVGWTSVAVGYAFAVAVALLYWTHGDIGFSPFFPSP